MHIMHEQYKEALFEKKPFAMAWMSWGQSAIAYTGNILTRSLSHPLTPRVGSQTMGWTRCHMDTRYGHLGADWGVQRLRTPSGGSCVSNGTTSSSSRTKPRCGASSPCRWYNTVSSGLVTERSSRYTSRDHTGSVARRRSPSMSPGWLR